MLKRLDSLLLKSFLPPFFLAFMVALFVLIMQVIWTVVADIMGKGVGLFLIVEILGYMSISLFPLALPIGILIASVLVFGNLSERYELAAMKSAGVSLTRIMAPLLILTILIAGFSFFCSNYLIPVSNLKYKTRLYDVKRSKPTLSIQERVFNYDFAGMTMRIGSKGEDDQSIEDVMIYNHAADNSGNQNLIMAERGKMYMTPDELGFVLELENGHQYQEMNNTKNSAQPYVKAEFETAKKVFDLTQFEIDRTDEERHKDHYSMQNIWQLQSSIDTLQKKITTSQEKSLGYFIPKDPARNLNEKEKKRRKNKNSTQLKSYLPDSALFADPALSFYETFTDETLETLLPRIKISTGRKKANLRREYEQIKKETVKQAKHIYEYHFKFSSALICIIFLFIGGPMGAIIRKGGYGYPLLITILFFMLYMVLSISFREMMKVGKMDAALAAWLPLFILTPVAILLTLQAMNDSRFINLNGIKRFFSQLIPARSN